jgi:hypothetical protein
VIDLITQALKLFEEASVATASKKQAAAIGQATPASQADVAAGRAQAYVEKARLEYVLNADDADDETLRDQLLNTLNQAKDLIALLDEPSEKVGRWLSFSRALLNLAQGDVDDELGTQGAVLDIAISMAAQALVVDPAARAASVQHAACLVAKAECEGETEDEESTATTTLLEQAVATLRNSLGSDKADEEAEHLQLLAQALIKLGQIHPDDEKAEALIGEGVESYRKAATLQPENRKLKQLVQMIEQQTS